MTVNTTQTLTRPGHAPGHQTPRRERRALIAADDVLRAYLRVQAQRYAQRVSAQ